MAVLLLDSARVESRDRKRAKEEYVCVCTYVYVCTGCPVVPGSGGRVLDSLCKLFLPSPNIPSVFLKVKLELKSPFSCCDWRLKNFIKD